MCIIFSLAVKHSTSPYGHPGDRPKEYNLNTQILSFLMPSNYKHLSEGFTGLCLVFFIVRVFFSGYALSCFNIGLVLSCVTVHLGVSESFVASAQLVYPRGFCVLF